MPRSRSPQRARISVPPTAGDSSAFSVRAPRAVGWFVLLGVLAAVFVQQLREEPQRSSAARGDRSPHSVWPGRIELTRRWVAPPPTHIQESLCQELVASVWMPSQQVSDSLLNAAFDESARATLLSTRRCVSDGCLMRISGESVLGISREARGALSRALGQWPQNTFYAMPMHRPVGTPPFRETPGLPDDARNVLLAASWDDDGGETISTPRAICAAGLLQPSRLAALRALWTVASFEVAVHVEHDEDISKVARYWAWGRDPSTLAARFRSRVSSAGLTLHLGDLLPDRLSGRVFQYAARPSDRHNCLNAVLCEDNSCPDLLDGDDAERRLRQSFHQVGSLNDLRAGDAVIWRNASGALVHGAAWLTDGMIFTKNGVSFLRPWHIGRIEAIQHVYRSATRIEYWARTL